MRDWHSFVFNMKLLQIKLKNVKQRSLNTIQSEYTVQRELNNSKLKHSKEKIKHISKEKYNKII